MQRRDFVAETVFLMGVAAAPDLWVAAAKQTGSPPNPSPRTPADWRDEAAAVKGIISDFYAVFYKERDKQKYRSLLTDDYLLLENGELMDADGDLALMPTPEDQYTRKDEFDFRHVKVSGD
jgi:hypothetical protein